MKIVILEKVKKKYKLGKKDLWVLREINLETEDGEFLSIVGHSGSGKTTLLNLIGAVDSSTAGEVIIT